MRQVTTEEYLEALFADAGLVELAHHHDRFDVTWHDSADSLLATARTKSRVGNLYTTMNAPKLRSINSIEKACNDDILRVTRIFFDFDPARPKDVASTPEQTHEAYLRKGYALEELAKSGWGLPIVGKSGNGFHLQYRTSLPADEETSDMLRAGIGGVSAGLCRRVQALRVTVQRVVSQQIPRRKLPRFPWHRKLNDGKHPRIATQRKL